MKFVIRDDDLNYFSTPADIEQWYADVFAQEIPVSFAMIPFVKPSSDVYPFLDPKTVPKIEDREYPISGNTELVAYVKSNPLIEILQHGCTHENKNGVFEYASRGDLTAATRRGRQELEQAFGQPVRAFAAPHDWINSEGVRAIEASHLDVIRGRGAGLRNWLWRWQYAAILIQMLFYRFPKYISFASPVYPYVLDFGKHKEVCSYRLEDTDVFEGLVHTHENSGIFTLVVHVHTLNEEKKARLLKLIAKARELGAQFVLPSAVFS